MTFFGRHRNWFEQAEAYCDRTAAAFRIVGGVALVVLLSVTVAEVFWRYVLNNSMRWAEDISTMSLAVVVAAAISYGASAGSHVCVNLIARVGGRRVTRFTDVVARLLGVAVTAIAAYALFVHGSCGRPCGSVTSNASISHTPFYYVLGASLAAYGLLLASQLLLGLATWDDEDPNEPVD